MTRRGDHDKGDLSPEGSDSTLWCKKSHSSGCVEAFLFTLSGLGVQAAMGTLTPPLTKIRGILHVK